MKYVKTRAARLFSLLCAFGSMGDPPAAKAGGSELLHGYLAYYAKEYCACYFVVGQSREFCSGYVIQAPVLTSVTLDEDEKTVEVSAFSKAKVKARYEGKPFGCTLAE